MIYFIQIKDSQGLVKIGFSENPEKRIKSIQTNVPYEIVTLCILPGSMKRERRLHQRFDEFRVRGEWFRFAAPLVDYIKTHNHTNKHEFEYTEFVIDSIVLVTCGKYEGSLGKVLSPLHSDGITVMLGSGNMGRCVVFSDLDLKLLEVPLAHTVMNCPT